MLVLLLMFLTNLLVYRMGGEGVVAKRQARVFSLRVGHTAWCVKHVELRSSFDSMVSGLLTGTTTSCAHGYSMGPSQGQRSATQEADACIVTYSVF